MVYMTFYLLDNKTTTDLWLSLALRLRYWLVLRLTFWLRLRCGNRGAATPLIERSLQELEVENLTHNLRHLAPPGLYQWVQYRPGIVTDIIYFKCTTLVKLETKSGYKIFNKLHHGQ